MIDWNLVATIASPIIALIVGAILNRMLEKRPKLISYLGHVSSFRLSGDKPTEVYTHSIIVRNAGRQPSHNVRIGHNYLPDNHSLNPSINHSVEVLPDGKREIVIPILVPNEQVTISYLYFPPITWAQIVGMVKSDEGFAKVLKVLPTPQLPKWQISIVTALLFIGLVASFYVLIKIGSWIYHVI